MNKQVDHIFVVPEDDANRQIANGFVEHYSVKDARIQVMPVAGGWRHVLKTFEDEYVSRLQRNIHSHVVLLIDFDHQYAVRRELFQASIPEAIRSRVFVLGLKVNPEVARTELGLSFEKIGESLAEDCGRQITTFWNHEQLLHNDPDRVQLAATVRSFLF